ncbi:cyd operon protein YbgE [Enterovibrio sp. ZSDZ35]|uniref:Cyd operon protein YbgE n=1 Tax=Enterovibrio qingdaonensis TaxID=2899818 RepID=A0ABT5QQF3_9GAMM|nr:cyd operon protein YbgE [Enterovibrio sp. ZSDZ35]MDD1782521.1 cyd operon protein YbgE [Enterovibrio sp. ZSDZ35]
MKNKLIALLDGLHDRLHKRVLMLLSLVLALVCGGLVMWDPQAFAAKLGGFTVANGLPLIWATCTGLIHGMAFKPRRWFWQLVFFPPFSWVIMTAMLVQAFT